MRIMVSWFQMTVQLTARHALLVDEQPVLLPWRTELTPVRPILYAAIPRDYGQRPLKR